VTNPEERDQELIALRETVALLMDAVGELANAVDEAGIIVEPGVGGVRHWLQRARDRLWRTGPHAEPGARSQARNYQVQAKAQRYGLPPPLQNTAEAQRRYRNIFGVDPANPGSVTGHLTQPYVTAADLAEAAEAARLREQALLAARAHRYWNTRGMDIDEPLPDGGSRVTSVVRDPDQVRVRPSEHRNPFE